MSKFVCLQCFERSHDAILTRNRCRFVVRPHARPVRLGQPSKDFKHCKDRLRPAKGRVRGIKSIPTERDSLKVDQRAIVVLCD